MNSQKIHTQFETFCHAVIAALLAVALLPSFAAPALAQAKAPAKGAPARPAKTAAPPAEPLPDDAAVRSIVLSNPSTPVELVRAIDLLLQMDYSQPAAPLVEKLAAAKVSADLSQQLVRDFGSAVFLKMAFEPKLQPAGKTVSDAILNAANKLYHDPARIKKSIDSLADPSLSRRRAAFHDLQAAQTDAVLALLAVLADPKQAAKHAVCREALVGMDGDSRQPLLATLESKDDALRAQTIEVLGRLKSEDALPLLAGLAESAKSEAVQSAARQAVLRIAGRMPRPGDAQKLLQREADEFFANRRVLETDLNGQVKIWRWDGQKKTPVVVMLPPTVAAAVYAARAATLLAQIDSSLRVQQIALASQLSAAAYGLGLDQQFSQPVTAYGDAYVLAKQRSPEFLESTMQYCVDAHRPIAATALMRLLGELGKPTLLTKPGNALSPVAAALRSDDRRLRFAATETVMIWNPDFRYNGSSFLPEALGYFASGYGARRAVVGHPSLETAQELAGMLAGLGIDAEPATNGVDLLRLSAANPDYEMVLVSTAIDHLSMEEVVERLRNEPKTAKLPVGVLIERLSPEMVKRFARDEPNAVAVDRPPTEAMMKILVEALTARSASNIVSPDERARQAGKAVGWISQLSGNRQQLYDLRRQQDVLMAALDVPAVALQAAAALGQIGTHEAQTALVELASRRTRPSKVRLTAAAEFGANVRRYGLRLTTTEIRQQYDRYNASEKLDAGTKQALGEILNWIEAPSKGR